MFMLRSYKTEGLAGMRAMGCLDVSVIRSSEGSCGLLWEGPSGKWESKRERQSDAGDWAGVLRNLRRRRPILSFGDTIWRRAGK